MSRVAAINARFRRGPYEADWRQSGALADAAVLVHMFDAWEEHDVCFEGEVRPCFHHWRADVSRRPLLSCSLIYADQQAPAHPAITIPVYHGGEGLILRPGATTKILCGTASDTGGGYCKSFCPHVSLPDTYDVFRDGRDGCGGSWRPEDFGAFLRRSSAWQRTIQARGGRMDYNEIVVDGQHWNDHLPHTVEAFFGGDRAREQRRGFAMHFGLAEDEVPLLRFDASNWSTPFSELI